MRALLWYWSGGGGGSQFALRLAHKLSRQLGRDGVMLSLRADDPAVAEARAMGFGVTAEEIVSTRKNWWGTLANLGAAAQVLRARAREADVVVLPMNFAAAAPLALGLRKKLIYCAHDPAPHPGDYAALGQSVTQGLLLRRADTIVALSSFAAGRLRAMGVPARKLRVAPLESVFEAAAASAPLQAGPVRMLLFGRMIAYKGLKLLSDSLGAIADRSDWRLTVAGAGPALDAKMRAALSRFPQVTISEGYVADVDALIDAHDLVLAPYISATQSGVVAQAVARGRAVVATDVGALAEQIGDSGWLARAVTPQDYAAAIIEALNDAPGRAEKAQRALMKARAAWNDASWRWLDA